MDVRIVELMIYLLGHDRATLARQQKQIEAVTTAMQKVSDQLELDRRGPQVAAKN